MTMTMTVVQGFFLLALISAAQGQSLTSSEPVVNRPGESVTLSCKVEGLSLAWLHWIRQKSGKGLEWIGRIDSGTGTIFAQSLEGQFSITKDTSRNVVYLEVKSLKPEDSAVYYCAREAGGNAFDYWGKGTMVTVTSGTPRAPVLFPLAPCGSGTGDMVTLGCLATEFTPGSLTFSWTRSGTALTDFIQYPPVQKGQFYMGVSQVQVKRQDWEAKQQFQCAVTHAAGESEANVPLPEPPFFQLPALKVLASSPDGGSEGEASFSCFAKDFSPKEYEMKWLKDDGEIFDKLYTINTPIQKENGKKVYSVASFLGVKTDDLIHDSTKFTCEFKGKDESGHDAFVNSTVIYRESCSVGPGPSGCEKADVEIEITGPTMKEMFVENKGTLLCKVKVNKPKVTQIIWENENGKILDDSTGIDGSKSVITLPLDITYDEWIAGAQRVCVVQHSNFLEPIKRVYERRIEGPAQRPSVFMLPPVEQPKTGTVTLTCYVKDFFPKGVLVSWLVDDVPADSDYDISTTIPVENKGSYSVYGQFTLSLQEWKDSEAVYSCVVHHESVVNTTKVIVRSFAHRSSQTNLVNLNMNIPETCKAH